MFLLSPRVTSNNSFTQAYKLLFVDTLRDCFNSTGLCSSEIVYAMCLKATNETNLPLTLDCIFSKNKIQISCKTDGKWDKTGVQVYNECKINSYLYRVALIRTINMIFVPLMIIIMASGVFKLYEYTEISREFHWRIVIMVLNVKIINLILRVVLTLLNSSEFLNYFCIIILLLTVYSTYFSVSSFMSLSLYIYCVVNTRRIQIRVIKSSLKRIAVMSPFIMIFIEFATSIGVGDTNMFMCQYEPLLSINKLLQVSVGTAAYFIMLIIRLRIFLKLKPLYIHVTITKVFRVEYDILGNRLEVSHRDLIRLINLLDTSLLFYGLFLILDWATSGSVFVGVESIYFFICAVINGINELIYVLFTLKVIWLNKTLSNLQKALDQWHVRINETVQETEAEHFFNALKLAAEDDDVQPVIENEP